MNQDQGDQSLLIADIAKHKFTSFSPTEQKVLFKFNRNITLPIGLSHIVVVNLEDWQLQFFTPQHLDSSDILNYKYPIITTEWIDEHTILMTTPDVLNVSYETLYEWQKDGSLTIEHIFILTD